MRCDAMLFGDIARFSRILIGANEDFHFRLHTGWSTTKPPVTLDAAEQDAILVVVRRNEQLESAERQRVGKLVERVEKIKERAAEYGPRFCRCVALSIILLSMVDGNSTCRQWRASQVKLSLMDRTVNSRCY